MKKIIFISSACVFIATLCPAALLTSFTDDFNRAALGDQYTLMSGAAYGISDSTVLVNGGVGNTFLNVGNLPTTADYTNGYGFTAVLDIFIPASGQASVVTGGLLVNAQDANNFWTVRFRGGSAAEAYIQLNGRISGVDIGSGVSGNMGTLSKSTWHTLKVSSAAAGVYEYAFSQRGSTAPIIKGIFTAKNILTGGSIGLYSENAPAGAYQFDNLSVTVEKSARELESK